MKISRLWIESYKNLRNCEVVFTPSVFLNAIIGSNGSGKSNLIEALLTILIGTYFKSPPPFDFEFDFQAQERSVSLKNEGGRLTCKVDGESVPTAHFAKGLRGGDAQQFFPEITFVYYSGECQRVRNLINRYRKHFLRHTSNPDTDNHKPLFVESTNQQARIILLSLLAHGHIQFLKLLGVSAARDVSISLNTPKGYDPQIHEPILWNTMGAIRKYVAAIDGTSARQDSRNRRRNESDEYGSDVPRSEIRTYYFNDETDQSNRITDLATRLEKSGDNLYLALLQLRERGILQSVSYRLKGRTGEDYFEFDQLSEGEKQMIAVIGGIRLVNQRDSLVLLDEPDTHLNPQWSWEYPDLLTEAFDQEQRAQSTVLVATHDPILISGLTSEEVWLAHPPDPVRHQLTHPVRHPRGQGIANLLCSSEFFGLPSSLDKETQKLLDERLSLSIKEPLTEGDSRRLSDLNQQLEIVSPGVSERDPEYVAFLRERHRKGG